MRIEKNDKRKGKNMTNVFTEIDNNFEGTIPSGADLVVVEMDDVLNGTFESAMVLYGFDEVGMFTETTMQFVSPVYGFLS